MPKKPNAYLRPNSLEDALGMLAKPGHIPLAGGAHLLATEAGVEAEAVVDLQDCSLDGIAYDDATGLLTVGAAARLVDLWEYLHNETLPAELTRLLQQAIHRAGPNTYRNAATPGGIVASRLPDSELLATLLVADATLDVRLPRPETVTLAAYLAAPEPPSGLITGVNVRLTSGRGAAERVARTPADYPIVSVAAWQPAGAPVRLAATGISARPERLPEAEAAVAGALDEASIAAAATQAKATANHPGDFRGDASYRAEMAAVLTRRVLRTLAAT